MQIYTKKVKYYHEVTDPSKFIWNYLSDSHQAKLIEEIEKAQTQLLKLNDGFATRCKKLADVVKNPWEDPVLMKLMKTKDAEIGSEGKKNVTVEKILVSNYQNYDSLMQTVIFSFVILMIILWRKYPLIPNKQFHLHYNYIF